MELQASPRGGRTRKGGSQGQMVWCATHRWRALASGTLYGADAEPG